MRYIGDLYGENVAFPEFNTTHIQRAWFLSHVSAGGLHLAYWRVCFTIQDGRLMSFNNALGGATFNMIPWVSYVSDESENRSSTNYLH